jgi:quinohemoprotein ethanol dehydrogenase
MWMLAATVVCGAGVASLQGQQTTARKVDEATLLKPADGDWVSYGRDYAEAHHSPLTQIDQSNVSRLGLAYAIEVGSEGKIETTPLVFDGVLYGTSTWSQVYAIDLRTHKLKWQWDPALVRTGHEGMGPRACCGPVNRGVALYDGKVYVGLLDGRLVALDAQTGKPVWAVQTTPPNTDYTITGAPRVIKGNVVIGQGGAEYGVRGFLGAYNAQTGKLAWKFYVVPGDPKKGFEDPALAVAAKTWNGEWWKAGGGGTPWDGIAYDPELNLVYVGTGNGSPWNANHRSPGGGDNLYLASIVALNADTGKYVWHYQTTPGDNWDYNSAQPMILADLPIANQTRKVLMQAPKNGFFYVLDRTNGRMILAKPFVTQTWAKEISPEGRPILLPGYIPTEEGTRTCPDLGGGTNFFSPSYDPAQRLFFVNARETCAIYYSWNEPFREGEQYESGGTTRPRDQRNFGALRAIDPLTGERKWEFRYPTPSSSGILTTASGLVFSGDGEGNIIALDSRSGKYLWHHHVGVGLRSTGGTTYMIDGRQHLLVPSGSALTAFALPQ